MKHFGQQNSGIALRRVRVTGVSDDASEVVVSDASGWQVTLNGQIRPKGMLSPEENEIWWIERVAGNIWLLRALERAGGVDQGTDVNAIIAAEIERQMAEQAAAEAARRDREAALAAGIMDGDATVLIQDTEPGEEHRNTSTLWIDTRNDLNLPMRWDDEYDQWVRVVDEIAMRAAQAAVAARLAAEEAERRAGEAEDAAQAAQQAANEAIGKAEEALAEALDKGRVIYGHPEQTPGEPNSLLIGPGNVLYRWDGEAWVEIPSGEMADIQDLLDDLIEQIGASLNELSDIQLELVGVQGMLDGKSTIWPLGSSPELGPDDMGDLRLVADGGVEYWDGEQWVEADPRVTEAVLGVADALDLANTKSTTYYKATPPTTDDIEHPETEFHTNDFWVRLEDNRLHRWDGEAWVEVKDGGLAAVEAELEAALGDISGIQLDLVGIEGLLDGKSTIYVQDTVPEGVFGPDNIGDIWIDTADGGRLYKVWDGEQWLPTDDPRLAEALDKVNSRIRTFYSPLPPSAPVGDPFVDGDLWLKTPENLLHRWDGEAWVEVQDTSIPILRDDVDAIDDVVKDHEDELGGIRITLPVIEGELEVIRDVTVPELRSGVEGAQQWIADTGEALDQGLTDARQDIDQAAGWIADTGSILDQKLETAFGGGDAFNLSDALDQVEGRANAAAQALIDALPPGGRVWRQDTPPPAGPERANDLWINTAEGNKPYTWDSTTDQWVESQDAAILEALEAAEDALEAAGAAITESVIEYAVGTSETTPPTTGWSTSTPTRSPGGFIWMRTVITYGSGQTKTTNPVLVTGNTGAPGAPAKTITLTAESHALTSPATGGTTSPATTKVTGTATNTTISVWQYSRNGGEFSNTLPPGVTRSGNVVTITGATMTDRTVSVRMSDGDTAEDTLTVAKVSDGATGGAGRDAYTVLLTNESHAFPGSPTGALAGSATTSVFALHGTTRQSVTVGAVTTGVTGLSAEVTDSGTNSPTITFTATTALTATSGTVDVPVTVDGQSFTRVFSWTVSRQGTPGDPGAPAATIDLTATTQALVSPPSGGTTSPATAVVTGTATNTTISVWQYSRNGGDFSNTLPPGVTRSGNAVTITGSTMTDRTVTVRMANSGGVADTMTVAKVMDGGKGDPGSDSYAVLLTNESHSFPGGASAAIAGSTSTEVMAFKGASRQDATVGTITGQVDGLTTSVDSNGTQAPIITVTVTTALTTRSGVLTIPVTVDGQTISRRFSWSLALQGTPGTPGVSIVSINPYYYRQSATADPPAQPTTQTPPAGWVTTEPEFLSGHVLYRSELVEYSDDTFAWTEVSLVSAWTLPRPHQSPNAPGFTDVMPVNSRWEQVADGVVVAVWVQTQAPQGAAWQMRALDLAVLKSTLAVIDEGVIERLWADVVRSRKITTDMLLVGSGDNHFPNGSLVGDISDFFTTTSGWEVDRVNDAQVISVTPGQTDVSTQQFPISTGKYRFRVDARSDVVGSVFYVQVEHSGPDLSPYVISGQVISGTLFGGFGAWATYEGEFEVTNAWSAEANLRLYANHADGTQTGTQQFRNFRVQSMTDASLIVDGGIAARHLNADDVWANFVRSRKITTDMLLVGSGENLVVDPRFLDDGLNSDRASVSTGTWSIQTDSNENVFEVPGGSTRTLRLISTSGSNADRVDLVTPGSTYRIRYDHRRAAGTSSQSVRPAVYYLRRTGTLTTTYPRSSTVATTTSWQTDEVEWTAPDDVIGAYFGVVATGGTTATHTQIRRPFFTSMTDPSLIVDGTIHATLNIEADGLVRAGDPDGRAAEMSGDMGIQIFASGDESGQQRRLSSRLGGPDNDELTLFRSDGGDGVHMTGNDGIMTEMLMVGNDPVIFGKSLLGQVADSQGEADSWLGNLSAGAVASGSLPGGRVVPVGATMGFSDISFEAVHGRTYMIVQSPGAWSLSSVGTGPRIDMIHYWTWDGSDPKIGDNLAGYMHSSIPTDATGFIGLPWVTFHDCDASVNLSNSSSTLHLPPGNLRMLTAVRTVRCQVTSGSSRLSTHLRVYDMGPTAPSSTNLNDGGYTPDPAPPATVFRSYWEANNHRTWNTNGSIIEAVPSSARVLSHGIYPWNTPLGQRTSIALFTGSNSKQQRSQQPGHNNLTITQALNGRTLRKAWVQVWTTETGQSSGATLQILQYASTGLPSTYTSRTATVSGPLRTGQWTTVEVPTTWFSTTARRGVGFATTQTSAQFFARIAGSNDTNGRKPRVILEYS